MSYMFRRWQPGDKLPSNWTGVPPSSAYALFFGNTQIGAAILGWSDLNNIFFIEIFEPHRKQGHGTVFISKIEEEIKKMGYDYITAFPVIDDTVWLKWGFKLEKVIDEDKLMKKKI